MKKMDYKNKTENTVQQGKEPSYDDDIKFFNKYTEALNKLRTSGEAIYNDYMRDIPPPESINKNSLIISVAMTLSVAEFERNLKEYKRSLLDGGEFSKLIASVEMKNEIENIFKIFMKESDEYLSTAENVSTFYSKSEYKTDLSNVKNYDSGLKNSYEKYKISLSNVYSALKKYKPKREKRDPSTISDPDESSSVLMLNSYSDILDAAEDFYDSFKEYTYKGSTNDISKKLEIYKLIFSENKKKISDAGFTEKTKFMKYNFEDYFSKTSENFTEAAEKLLSDAAGIKSESVFVSRYNEVVQKYNYLIQSYNTSISSINSVRSFY